MKVFIVILMVLAASLVFHEIYVFYNRAAKTDTQAVSVFDPAPPDTSIVTGESLPGLPTYLETSLAQAQQQGAEELGKWLKTWSKQVQDPRLAWIELDYVVLLNLKDHKAARERFLSVKARTTPGSAVHDRILKLDSAYEQ